MTIPVITGIPRVYPNHVAHDMHIAMGHLGILAAAGLVWAQNCSIRSGLRNSSNWESRLGLLRFVWIRRFVKTQEASSDKEALDTSNAIGPWEARFIMILLIILTAVAGDCLLFAFQKIIR